MSHIDALDGAIRPETAPITATLDEEDETSEAFESVSAGSVDVTIFQGRVV